MTYKFYDDRFSTILLQLVGIFQCSRAHPGRLPILVPLLLFSHMLLREFHAFPKTFASYTVLENRAGRTTPQFLPAFSQLVFFFPPNLVLHRQTASSVYIARFAISTFCLQIVAFNSSLLFFMASFSRRRLQISILISTSISQSSVRDGSTDANDDSLCPPKLVCFSFDTGSTVAMLNRLGVPISSSLEPWAPRMCSLLFIMCWLLVVVIRLLLEPKTRENYVFSESI